jgi:hypothetical protein
VSGTTWTINPFLITDNVPGHPINTEDYASNIKVVSLPPNSSLILQPMGQGAIATFKAYYLHLVMTNRV